MHTKFGKCRPSVDEQGHDDPSQGQQNQQGEHLRQAMKQHVLQPLALRHNHQMTVVVHAASEGGLHVLTHQTKSIKLKQEVRRSLNYNRRMTDQGLDYFWICDQTLERICSVKLSGKGT